MPRPIRATISAGALAHNLRIARRHADGAKLWAVIKANAYGHGVERAARAFAEADGFAVLDFAEAARLREAGIDKPILMLEGVFDAGDVGRLAERRLTPVVHTEEQIRLLERHAEAPLDVYLKVNTGMNRLGFAGSAVRAAFEALRRLASVRQVTLMTHFADADGREGVQGQLARFAELTAGFPAAPRSTANSAALLRFPEARGDWARPGIMLYGCSPFADRSAEALGLRPAMTLASEIIALQRLTAGERVGYGFSYQARVPMSVGVVACGYADGYPRHAPSGTPVLVNGRRTTIVGRVSMDMLCVDLSGIPDCGVGARVTLWGEGLSADEVAAHAGTLSYELLCALAPRVPVSDAP